MARSGRMVVISNMLMFGALIIILVHSKPLDAAVALNNKTSECAFPFNHYNPVINQNECRPAMNKMFDCLTYLLGATQLPSANCCSGVVDSWEHFPVCLCRLTFYPPGNITAIVRESLTPLCNVSADLCTPCPELLGLLGMYPNFPLSPNCQLKMVTNRSNTGHRESIHVSVLRRWETCKVFPSHMTIFQWLKSIALNLYPSSCNQWFVSSWFWAGRPSQHVRYAAPIFEEAHLMMTTLKHPLSGENKMRQTCWSLFWVGLPLVWLLYENPPMLGYSQIIWKMSRVDLLKALMHHVYV